MNIKLFSPSLWALSPQCIYNFMQTFRLLMDLRLIIHGSLEVCVPAGQGPSSENQDACTHEEKWTRGGLLNMLSDHPSLCPL